jgi:hypothetical protein
MGRSEQRTPDKCNLSSLSTYGKLEVTFGAGGGCERITAHSEVILRVGSARPEPSDTGQMCARRKLSANVLLRLTRQCPPNPEHRIVPNALKSLVEKQQELLALIASTCSRLQSVR